MNLGNQPQLSAEVLERLLLYGSEASHRRLAEAIARSGDDLPQQLALLAETARSEAPNALRARCTELLMLVVEQLWSDSRREP